MNQTNLYIHSIYPDKLCKFTQDNYQMTDYNPEKNMAPRGLGLVGADLKNILTVYPPPWGPLLSGISHSSDVSHGHSSLENIYRGQNHWFVAQIQD